MRSGKLWVIGFFVLGSLAGLSAVIYWSQPENAVRGAFTMLHTSILRNNRKEALRHLSSPVIQFGKAQSPEEFLSTYEIPVSSSALLIAPCPSIASHWGVILNDRVYCFLLEGRRYKLHFLDRVPCTCREPAR
jgi:hypothetical protein